VAFALRDTVVDAIVVTGGIEAEQSIELRPEVDGRLVQILVREGREVAAGTPLFKVDDAEIRAQVARLTADRDLAEQALRRTQELIAQNASSPADLEQAEASARVAQAQLDLRELRLERAVVRAPFSGLVGQRFVSLGDYVTSSTRLVTLQTVDPQRAVFQVPERYAQRLRVGQTVAFNVAALPEVEFTGVVDFVDPLVQLPARTILVKATVRNPRRDLKAGMFIEARLETESRPDAVIVPEDAVLPLSGADFVWVIAPEETATRRQVDLGVRLPGFVEVRSGVAAGERVVVGGLERLTEGAPVHATPVERRPG
jgi:membrane fusion protein (multidrug efflux system)